MNFTVRIGSQSFLVRIDDPNTSPVIAIVDGERIEVWPEAPAEQSITPSRFPETGLGPFPRPVTPKAATSATTSIVRAPLPGIIRAIATEPGADLAAAGEICVIEAMKMKNSIRAPHAGRVVAVCVRVDQWVAHGDAIIEITR